MNSPLYGVYGASGFGQEVMPLARAMLASHGLPLDRLLFIDDNPKLDLLNGQPVWSLSMFLAQPASQRHVVIAIANSTIRAMLADQLEASGVLPWSLHADNVVVMDNVQIGDGVVLSPFVTLTSNICIGRHFHANLYSYVAHDCVIGDFVTFAPGVKCNGNVHVEDHAYIGTGAILKQGTPDKPLVIGKGAVVGMGAVVTKDVPPGVTVVGNPARPLVR